MKRKQSQNITFSELVAFLLTNSHIEASEHILRWERSEDSDLDRVSS